MAASFTFGNVGGTSAAPAPLFGTTPSTTSVFGTGGASGGLFGSNSGGGTLPSTSLFGSAPAPAAPFSFAAPPSSTAAPSSLFGSMSHAVPPPPTSNLLSNNNNNNSNTVVAQPPTIAGNMYYSQLTPDLQRAIDTIHTAMMQHKKTIYQLQTIGPQLLQPAASTAHHTTHTDTTTPLQQQIVQLQQQLQQLDQVEMPSLRNTLQQQYQASEQAHVTTTLYATWPVEGLAARMGIPLLQNKNDHPQPTRASTGSGSTTNPSATAIDGNQNNSGFDETNNDLARYNEVQEKIRRALTLGMAAVDRIDRMPSPYYWDTIQQLERRTKQLQTELSAMVQHQQHAIKEWNIDSIQELMEDQHVRIRRLQQQQLPTLHDAMELLKLRYRLHPNSRGEHNVLDQHTLQEQQRRTQIQEQILRQYLQAAATNRSAANPPNTTPAPPPLSTPAPLAGGSATTGLFGAAATSIAPAPSLSSFGNTTSTNNNSHTTSSTTTAATNSNNNTFGNALGTATTTSTAAPVATNLFGATANTTTTTPASGAWPPSIPTFGGGSTTALTTTPLFGSTTTTSQTRKTKSNSRGGGRLRR